ncbi:hypothetical protein BPMI_01402 [Candidatus Burkholderia pumila]|uniref:Uncharacterized protein n=1 Tax=Candidatus Burkholderia pumila TaxID=1090375 RepID=A0ABR5HJZ5_9BURK|nr:hypothetical protein BPMI_01402 [Candidatus Burkholderia pumila]
MKLYRKDEGDEKPAFRFGYPVPRMEEGTPYWESVNELAHLIVQHLKLLDPDRFQFKAADPLLPPAATSAGVASVVQSGRTKVWLAEPTDDHEWEHVARALRQADCDVLPASCETYDRFSAQAFEQAVEKDLKAYSLFVQLLGKREGHRPQEGLPSFTRMQAEHAARWPGPGRCCNGATRRSNSMQ